MVEYALQRLNMVESQVRPSNLTDRRIARAMLETARETFLPEQLQSVAYSDMELMIAGDNEGQEARALLAPRTVAQMIQALELDDDDVVLLVGAGSGYEVALLAKIAQTVVALESDAALASAAEAALEAEESSNAVVVTGPLADGYASEGPFNAIFVNGGVDDVPTRLLDQLKDGGRLTAIRREGELARLVVWLRVGEHFSVSERNTAAAAVLPGFAREPVFEF